MEKDLFNYQTRYEPNTNFGFPTDEDTQYLKTSTGEILPYKLFSGRTLADTNPAILREQNHQGYATDFALVERQFSENKSLSFSAGTKISNVNDVAWLFRALEDEAVEHTFALYRFKDDSYLVQHLSTGGITSTVVDLRLLTGNVFKLQPESITLVHNHPSGQLISSKHDKLMLQRLKDVFNDTGVKVENGIVINIRSGKYLIFNEELGSDQILELKSQNQTQKNIGIFSFNKQVFAENYQPQQIKGPEDIATYISSQKFGVSDKTEAIILNNANEIVGKFILPQHRQFEKMTELMTIHAGTAVILFGNNVNDQMFREYKEKLEVMGFSALDAILLESGNYYSISEKTKISLDDDLVEEYSGNNIHSEPVLMEGENEYKSRKSKVEPHTNLKEETKEKYQKIAELYLNQFENEKHTHPEDLMKASQLYNTLTDKEKIGFIEYFDTLLHYDFADNEVSPEERSQILENIEKDLENFAKVKTSNTSELTDKTIIHPKNPNIMETTKEFNQVDYLKNQLKYLGFGEDATLHKDLEKGIKSKNQEFEIKTSSDKALAGNKVDFTLKFNKTESGGVFLNAYHAKLTKENGEEISHNFPVNRENTFTAKEAVNLLEGRSVKIEFHNPKSDQQETAFVQFNFEEPKTEKGNYMFQNFYQNYGVDTEKIVEKSNLVFDKPEYKENTIKSLEKGNVVKVKFELDEKVMEGKAVLNPQYKNLNLYDNEMNRINTNKPLQGLENEEKNDKANVKEQSIKR